MARGARRIGEGVEWGDYVAEPAMRGLLDVGGPVPVLHLDMAAQECVEDGKPPETRSKVRQVGTIGSSISGMTFNSPPPLTAGWYPDPQNPSVQRYWDGTQWAQPAQPVASATPVPNRAKKPIFKRAWFWVVVIVVVIVIIIIATQSGKNPGVAPTTSSATSQTTEAPATNAAPASEPPVNDATATATAPAATTISNGDHAVGPGFPAGVYRAEVDKGLFSLCTVSQQEGDNVLDVRNANEGSVIFTVADRPGSVVSFSGCQNIGLAQDMVRANPDPVTNGYWLVGSELQPGTYQCAVDTAGVFPLGTVTQFGADGQVVDIRNANEGNVIFTVQDQAGSVVSFSGCSTIVRA
ncbi:MAG: DUF2510 domain-containing protein [Propionibacteriaceae bacterium]|nr:DUF2510 domain-containing protein [Propionibacteriaceae bacterium]